MTTQNMASHQEETVTVLPGWLMMPVLVILLLADIALFIYSIAIASQPHHTDADFWELFAPAALGLPILFILLSGLFTLQPNEARVLILFGAYKGTVRQSGFHWANPFYSRGSKFGVTVSIATSANPGSIASMARRIPAGYKISLRARTHNMGVLKVNDKRGNPIDIGAVVVWRVNNTAQAVFDVDNYSQYVETQSETALRHIASVYAYDHGEDAEITLRSGVDEVSQALRKELQDRLEKAGVVVDDARLTHLAYSQEIAQAMLRRQQAEAVIAARTKIVQGAVSMVEMALKTLAERQVVVLDDERKAAMVSNLMVVLCGESEVHPVVNTGTLYN